MRVWKNRPDTRPLDRIGDLTDLVPGSTSLLARLATDSISSMCNDSDSYFTRNWDSCCYQWWS